MPTTLSSGVALTQARDTCVCVCVTVCVCAYNASAQSASHQRDTAVHPTSLMRGVRVWGVAIRYGCAAMPLVPTRCCDTTERAHRHTQHTPHTFPLCFPHSHTRTHKRTHISVLPGSGRQHGPGAAADHRHQPGLRVHTALPAALGAQGGCSAWGMRRFDFGNFVCASRGLHPWGQHPR